MLAFSRRVIKPFLFHGALRPQKPQALLGTRKAGKGGEGVGVGGGKGGGGGGGRGGTGTYE